MKSQKSCLNPDLDDEERFASRDSKGMGLKRREKTERGSCRQVRGRGRGCIK